MPLPATKVFLATATAGLGGYTLTPQETGDFGYVASTYPTPSWVGAIGDLNGDGIAEVITGVPGNSDKDVDAGRIYINFGSAIGGTTAKLGDVTSSIRIDGAIIGDHAGIAVGAVGDQNGDGLQDILVGAPLAARGGALEAGVAYVVWSSAAAASHDLADLNFGGSGEGFAIYGEQAGDHAGHALGRIADLNGDGKEEILVGAPGANPGGADSGAAYVVWGRSADTPVLLGNVAAGTGGFRIAGEAAGDAAGTALVSVADLNGDGLAEILVGAAGNDAGGSNAGAAYVVFGKATGTAVSLTSVAAGTGGFRITGAAANERVGTTVAALGDINGDGLGDMLIGAVNKAYVVFGKADTAAVDLSSVAAGSGGFVILPESANDLSNIAVAGGGDLNADGIGDIVIGASHNTEGGVNAGAVYVVWGGGSGTVDLSAISLGAGGAKVVGSAGSLTGSSVAIAPDMNGDGRDDLVIGAPGGANPAVSVLFAPTSWVQDLNVYGTNAADVLGFGAGGVQPIGDTADTVFGLGGADSIAAFGGDDSIDGGSGADTMIGGTGNDRYEVDAAGDLVVEAAGEGADTVFSSTSYTLPTEVEALVLTAAGRIGTGHAGDNLLIGTTGADMLRGLDGADTLSADAGNDSLDGGTGADSMAGGAGNDAYAVDNAGDVVSDSAGADTVTASLDYTLGADIEALVLAGAAHSGTGHEGNNTLAGGSGADSLFGLGGADSIAGNGGDDRLDGGSGADSMAGGAGNDLYLVDNTGDRAIEAAGGGADTVVASADFTLGTEVETLVLALPGLRGTGNAAANLLVGSTGGETLDGGAGADTLQGGAGDDLYVVDQLGDVVVEEAGGGHDVVRSAVSYALGGTEIEDLVLTGVGLSGTGNAFDNAIAGGTGADTLDGGAGADTLTGAAGNDLYLVDAAGDLVVEAAGGGADTVLAAVDTTLADEVETLVLTGAARHGIGNAGDNLLRGTAGDDSLEGALGADTLDGGAGADTMAGGEGNDTYFITDPGDVVVELPGGGIDTVIVSTDWTLAAGAGVENVQLIGTGRQVTGNAENNTLSGNSGDDTLDGAEGDDLELGGDGDDELRSHAGLDTLSGGAGNDRYVVHGGSVHIEDFLGDDTLDASESAEDDYIDLSDGGPSTIGGQQCDFGQGGSAAGPLDLQFLQDSTGSFADDIANVRLLVPQVVAALQAVQFDSTFGMSSFRDKPIGGFGAPGDWVYRQETALSKDTTALTAAYTSLVAANGADGNEAQIEALMQLALHAADVGFRLNSARFVVLFTDADFHVAGDGAAAGILTPNNGDGVLDGTPPGTGEDYPTIAQVKAALEAANIIPVFAVAGGFGASYQALVTQLGRGAQVTLTADSSNVVAAITTGLTAVTQTRIENALGGDGADTIIGNAAHNRLDGGLGNDVLDGGADADTLSGGGGNDLYRVDNAGDVLEDSSGRDTVEASCDWTLGTGFEHLTLTGAAVHGVGNAAGNRIVAAAGGSWLEGLGGNDLMLGGDGADTLDGGTGADRLIGGRGDDLYLVDDAGDTTQEIAGAAGGRDTVEASLDWTLGIGLEVLVLRGAATHGIGNAAANTLVTHDAGAWLEGLGGNDILTGGLGADTLDGSAGNDRMAGGDGDDTYILDSAGDRVTETATGGHDTVVAHISYTLRAGIEVLRLAGAAVAGTGNSAANEIEGSSLDNLLSGGSGADTISGGGGADTLVGGRQADVLTGGAGGDLFLFGTVLDRGDRIVDFDPLEDMLGVSAAGFGGGLAEGALPAPAFDAGTAATEAFGQFLWDAAHGRLLWDADGTGAGGPVLLATLSPGLALAAADILVTA